MIDQMKGHQIVCGFGNAEQRVRQAGADRAVNPYQIGGLQLAHLAVEQ